MKKLLILYYTQSGQLADVVNSFATAFSWQEISVEVVRIKPVNDFSFPWTSERFFDAMPESVLGIPVPLQNFELKETKYDLIVIAYQPWFLSLSIPINSLLHEPKLQAALKDTPVVTLIGARNMWINSQEKLKKILNKVGARVVGNIALVDRNSNLTSAVTILYWMLTGKKDRYLGVFPQPGIAQGDIARASQFGNVVKDFLLSNNFDGLQQELVKNGAAEVNPNLMFIEERAPKLFAIWANIIIKRKNRKAWLVLFKYYLLVALFIVAPVVLSVYTILFKPFLSKSIRKKQLYYQGIDA